MGVVFVRMVVVIGVVVGVVIIFEVGCVGVTIVVVLVDGCVG